MATARFMLWSLLCALAPGALSLSACAKQGPPLKLVQPEPLVAPYPPQADVLWVVAPLSNESGTSLVDELAVTDELVNQIQQAQNVSVLPTNRALAGLRALGIPAVRTPEEAIALAAATGADATLVGTITAWDPYDPPTIGLTVALIPRTAKMRGGLDPEPVTDPIALRTATREDTVPAATPVRPASAVSDLADGANHGVLAEVQRFAHGRHDDRTAMGWQIYVKSMRRYTEFVCYRVTKRLLGAEAARLGVPAVHDKTTQ